MAILQVGSFLGRALSGVLADKFGVWNMYTLSGLTSAISLFAFWIASPLPDAVIVLGLIIYGFGSGAWITLVAASCGAISPVREFGMRLGMLWSLSSIGILAGPVICGGELFSAWSVVFPLISSAHQCGRPKVRLRSDLLRDDNPHRRHGRCRACGDAMAGRAGLGEAGAGRRDGREGTEAVG